MDKFKAKVFLHFLTENIDRYINSANDGLAFIEFVTICIDRADCEKGSELFYQGANKDKFLEQLMMIEELGNFGMAPPDVAINILLQDAYAENWEENPYYKPNECHYKIQENQYDTTSDIPDVLKEIYERKIADNQSKYILLNLYNQFIYNDIKITICKIYNNNLLDYIDVFYLKNFKELDRWFNENRTPRNYNFEDNRHIETHPDYIKNKSPLLGGMGGKTYAEFLLKNAIGDKKETQRLYNFDENHKCYIQFEYEGDNPQNQYHGYHLVKPKTHEVDKKAVRHIPPRVIKILDYRQRNDYHKLANHDSLS